MSSACVLSHGTGNTDHDRGQPCADAEGAGGRTAASRVSGAIEASVRTSPVSAGPRRPRLVDSARPPSQDPPAFPLLNADVASADTSVLAVADLRSVTSAARHLHLSQPAISHQLAALEREAGTALLTREHRGVRLTAAGRAALPEARWAVAAADDAIRLARAVGQGVGGTLRVVCAQSRTVALPAPLLARWNLDRPGDTVSLRESTDPETAFAMLESAEATSCCFRTSATRGSTRPRSLRRRSS